MFQPALPAAPRPPTLAPLSRIPNHDDLRVGTLAAILADVGRHHGLSRETLVEKLFGR